MNIPTKQMKQTIGITSEPLTNIWNIKIVQNKKFATKLKLADLTPIFKKLEKILAKHYRAMHVLPSKVFEILMQKQVNGNDF